jgi:DinB superfamily
MANPASVLMVELLMSADRIITAAQAAPPPADPSTWAPAVVVGHLSLVDTEVWLPRIDEMVASRSIGSRPLWVWWEPDSDVTTRTFAGIGVDEAGARLLASRTTLLHRLRELSPGDWAAKAEHVDFGVIDVQGLLMQALGHDEEHRAALLQAEVGQ